MRSDLNESSPPCLAQARGLGYIGSVNETGETDGMLMASDVTATCSDFCVESSCEACRLDRFLALQLPSYSRNRLQGLIRANQVEVNAATVVSCGFRLKVGDRVRLRLPPPIDAAPEPQAIRLKIVFEDEDLIVVNKPSGLVVHPSPGHRDGTLVNALLYHARGGGFSGIGGVRRPGIVHRLDKETSGVMVVAKNDASHRHLALQFSDHGRSGSLDRRYYALVWGCPLLSEATIEKRLMPDRQNYRKVAIVRDVEGHEGQGKFAKTHYRKCASFGDEKTGPISLLACRLFTGRTHQIRVHLTDANLPLIGDPLYGVGFKSKARRWPDDIREKLMSLDGSQALHAFRLAFIHPRTGEKMTFDAPLPGNFDAILKALQAYSLRSTEK